MRVLLAAGGMRPEPGGVPLVSADAGLSADAAAAALRSGWLAARPDDELTVLPVPDGGPGSALVLPAARVHSRTVLHGAGPLGDIREVDLVRLALPETAARETADPEGGTARRESPPPERDLVPRRRASDGPARRPRPGRPRGP